MKRKAARILLGAVFIVLGISLVVAVLTDKDRAPQGRSVWIPVFIAGGALITTGIKLVITGDGLRDTFENLLRALR